MSAASLPVTSNLADRATTFPPERLLRAYFVEAKYESLRMLRNPGFSIPFLGLPAALLLFFGVLLFGGAIRNNPDAAKSLFTAFSVLGVMGPGMFGFGMVLAHERDQGLVRLKRALPAPPAAYLVAKMVMCILFGVIIMISMMLCAVTFMHSSLSLGETMRASLICILATLPFSALGLLLGVWTTARSAPGIVNVVYQATMHLSGLYYPLPKFMQTMAVIWPAFHLQQLVLSAMHAPSRGSNLIHIGVLAGLTLVFTPLAVRRLRRQG
jgi:ABC-2 type transport system permease protein